MNDNTIRRLEFIMAAPAAMDRISELLRRAGIWSMPCTRADLVVHGVARLIEERDAAVAEAAALKSKAVPE